MILRLLSCAILALGIASSTHLLYESAAAWRESGPVVLARDGPIHWVQRGETLSEIAARHGLTLEELLSTGDNRDRFPVPDRVLPNELVELPPVARPQGERRGSGR